MSTDIVEVHVSGPGAILTQHALLRYPEAELTVHYQSSETHGILAVENCDLAAFETELQADPSIGDVQRIKTSPTRRVYTFTTGPDVSLISTALLEFGIQILHGESRPSEANWLLRLRCPDRDALKSFRAYCENNDIYLTIDKITREAAGDSEFDAVGTEKQDEALRLAFERGYYDVPRRTSLAELADELDVGKQAVSERLRRGLSSVLEQYFRHRHP